MKQNNPALHGYSMEPICDNHVHLKFQIPIDATVQVIDEVMQHFNYSRLQACAMSVYDRTDNYRAFYLKSKLSPKVYVGASLDHHFDERDTAEYYLQEIQRYRAMGCDGVKMLEGKMFFHRKLGKPLCDPVFDLFYGYCEEHNIPITLHLGDPIDNWDLSKMSEYAIKKGWYCGPEDPTREELRQEVYAVLDKFPKLTIIFAHFNFMGDELDKAEGLMEKYPNICFDLTPGGEMFIGFTNDWERARNFFIKYQDRLLYGTVSYNFPPEGLPPEQTTNHIRINLLRRFLEQTEVFTEKSKNYPFKPFGFEGEILDKIYRKNFIRLYGETPRPLDRALILQGAKALQAEKDENLTELMQENLQTVIDHFEK